MTDLDPRVATYAQDPAPYLAAVRTGPPAWLDELELRPAPPHHRMGTRALDLDHWFRVDEHRPAEIELRRRLLAERPGDVLAVRPGADDACAEVLELVSSWLSDRGLAGGPADPGGVHPLAAAGLLVQDDLCVMVRRDSRWHLDAAMLCFPSVWVLAEKVGHTVAAIHAPVDHYDRDLEARVDVFFDRLRVERPVWRRNVSLTTTPALFLPYSKLEPVAPPAVVGADGSPYWLRSERQTLRKLPRTGAILFAIRVQLAPASVLLARADVAAAVLGMVESWDAPMRDLKAADSLTAFTSWLRTVSATSRADGGRLLPR